MKTLLAFTLASMTCSSFAQSRLLDYAVFSKENITYSRSDFEGAVVAGKTISVQDFLFVSGIKAEGIKAGEWFNQLRGQINSQVNAGKNILLINVNALTSITAENVFLDQTSVSGRIKTKYLNITTSHMGYPTSSHGGFKKMSNHEAVKRHVNLKTEIAGLSHDLDLLSKECNSLSGTEIQLNNGQIILSSDNKKNVFNISAETIMKASTIEFAVPRDSTTIINVSGARLVIENLGIVLNGLSPRNIIWNIFEAEELVISNSGSLETFQGRAIGLPGVFLAPEAKTTFTEAVITGSLFVKDLDGDEEGKNGGQVNDGTYTGETCRTPVRGKR